MPAESGSYSILGPDMGQVVLTSSGTAEPTSTLYISYFWGDRIPSGSSIVQPAFGSTANDRYVVFCHKKAQQNKDIGWRIWRMQVARDFKMNFDNGSDNDINVGLHLIGLADTKGHASCPLFDVSEVDMEDVISRFHPGISGSGAVDWDTQAYEPYRTVAQEYPI
jgi:hypothetical protein